MALNSQKQQRSICGSDFGLRFGPNKSISEIYTAHYQRSEYGEQNIYVVAAYVFRLQCAIHL